MSQNTIAEALPFMRTEDIYSTWLHLAKQLEQIKAAEAAYRIAVAQRCFQSVEPEGTFRAVAPNGDKLKLVNKLNYSFKTGADDWQANYDALAAEIGASDADAVVVWKPEVGVRIYKQLTGKGKEIADKMISTKPGMPALTIETE